MNEAAESDSVELESINASPFMLNLEAKSTHTGGRSLSPSHFTNPAFNQSTNEQIKLTIVWPFEGLMLSLLNPIAVLLEASLLRTFATHDQLAIG